MKFGEKLEKLRIRDGMTFVDLGKAIKVSPDTISGYVKNNNQNISVQYIKKIADYFNVSIDYLLSDEDNTLSIVDNGKNTINDISDILILLEELKYKANKEFNLVFDGKVIDDRNKQCLIDGVDVLINILKSNTK